MRKFGSYLASDIDREYQKRKRAKMEKEFIEKYCKNCKNRNVMICNITQNIQGDFMCVEYASKGNTNDNKNSAIMQK